MTRPIVFLGPSLPRARAVALLDADFRAPARQGDVFRALVERPSAIALIDGVFEQVPSVWHHELRAAVAAGVPVYGASSMGALRAAELADEGMVGVGEIFAGYREGELVDDADVALLHGDAESGFRPLTLPLVNAKATIEAARRARVLTPAEAKGLLAAASGIFYQERRWAEVQRRWAAPEARKKRFAGWLPKNAVDLKARDAELCLRTVASLGKDATRAPRPFHASSFVRRRRLLDAHAAALAALEGRGDRDALADAGTRTLLLAHLARVAGVTVSPDELRDASAALASLRLAPDELATLAEALCLERRLLEHPERFVSDGPSRLEGLALEAARRSAWPALRRRR